MVNKHKLLPAVLLTITPLIAFADMNDNDEDEEMPETQEQESCEPSPPPTTCEPCQPLTRMNMNDAGAQPPVIKTHDCGSFDISMAYLYWVAKLDELGYAYDHLNQFLTQTPIGQTVPFSPTFSVPKGHVRELPENWNSGFRVGLGYLFPTRPWSFLFDWTRYRNASSRHLFNPNFSAALLEFSTPGELFNNWPNEQAGVFRVQTIKANWSLQYDTLDFEFKNDLFFGKHFAIAPYAGFRAAFLNQRFNVHAEAQPPATLFSTDHHRGDFTGVGFRGGADGQLRCGPHFSFFADAAMTLLIGHFNVSRKTVVLTSGNSQPFTVTNVGAKFQSARMNVDTTLGIRWTDDWMCGMFHYRIDLGYELQWWEGQNEFYRFLNRPIQIYSKNGGDLMLHGLTASLTFEF